MRTVAIGDPVNIRDQNGIWKPATITETRLDGFTAEWKRSAGCDYIKVRYSSTIAWRHADAPVPS